MGEIGGFSPFACRTAIMTYPYGYCINLFSIWINFTIMARNMNRDVFSVANNYISNVMRVVKRWRLFSHEYAKSECSMQRFITVKLLSSHKDE